MARKPVDLTPNPHPAGTFLAEHWHLKRAVRELGWTLLAVLEDARAWLVRR